jgi:hypothetical protein
MRDGVWCRRPVREPGDTLAAEARQPLPGRASTDSGGLRCRLHRPALFLHPLTQQQPTARSQTGVSMGLHRVSLALEGFDNPQCAGRPGLNNLPRNYS